MLIILVGGGGGEERGDGGEGGRGRGLWPHWHQRGVDGDQTTLRGQIVHIIMWTYATETGTCTCVAHATYICHTHPHTHTGTHLNTQRGCEIPPCATWRRGRGDGHRGAEGGGGAQHAGAGAVCGGRRGGVAPGLGGGLSLDKRGSSPESYMGEMVPPVGYSFRSWVFACQNVLRNAMRSHYKPVSKIVSKIRSKKRKNLE